MRDYFRLDTKKEIKMKSLYTFVLVFTLVFSAAAQTPIDGLQKQNLDFLEYQEDQGYEFRSQIITEFDRENAEQNVNINLSKDFSYIIVALGDSNIPAVNLDIKPANGAEMEPYNLKDPKKGRAIQLMPTKSGKFKITIGADDLGPNDRGFISFMVLRKQ